MPNCTCKKNYTGQELTGLTVTAVKGSVAQVFFAPIFFFHQEARYLRVAHTYLQENVD
jgi:hypothetical protein